MNYMLTERAANALRKLLRDANAVVPAPHQRPQKTRPDMAGGGSSKKSRFAFEISFGIDEETGADMLTVSAGAVQVGGYSYFVDGQDMPILYDEFILCLVFDLPTCDATFAQIESEEQVKTFQDDMDKFIVPLYKVAGGDVKIDYRTIPYAGIWEYYPTEGQ